MKAKSNNYRGKVDISVSQNFITSKNTIYKLIKKGVKNDKLSIVHDLLFNKIIITIRHFTQNYSLFLFFQLFFYRHLTAFLSNLFDSLIFLY